MSLFTCFTEFFYFLLMFGKLFLKYSSFSLKSSWGNFINFIFLSRTCRVTFKLIITHFFLANFLFFRWEIYSLSSSQTRLLKLNGDDFFGWFSYCNWVIDIPKIYYILTSEAHIMFREYYGYLFQKFETDIQFSQGLISYEI